MNENQNELKPLPCPFCGGEARLESDSHAQYVGPAKLVWLIGCKNSRCDCESSTSFDTKEEALAFWNTRATSQADRQVEDLQYALVRLILLKDHKDKHGKDNYYQTWQPKAWEFARGLLKKDQQVHPVENQIDYLAKTVEVLTTQLSTAERQITAIRAAMKELKDLIKAEWVDVADCLDVIEKILEEVK